jgi:hypothetical protein
VSTPLIASLVPGYVAGKWVAADDGGQQQILCYVVEYADNPTVSPTPSTIAPSLAPTQVRLSGELGPRVACCPPYVTCLLP